MPRTRADSAMNDTLFVALGTVAYLAFVALLTLLDDKTLDRRR